MALSWLSRVFGQSKTGGTATAAPKSELPTNRGSTPHQANASEAAATHKTTPASTPAAATEQQPPALPPPPPTPVDQLIAQLGATPSAKASPDAPALLELLAASPDAVIRPLPAAARATLALTDDPNISRAQFAEKLSSDPSLVQALLRTANSALFGAGKEPVIAVEPSLDRIGIGGAKAILYSNAVEAIMSRPGGVYNKMATEVWNHMVRSAPLARTIAKVFQADPDEALSVALLHDVGKLVIFDRMSVLRASLRRDLQFDPAFIKSLLNDLHEPLGEYALTEWGMGERLARAIGAHHRRTSAGENNPLSEVVFVAELADHAQRTQRPLDMQRIWFDARITVDFERLTPYFKEYSIPFVF